MASKEDAKVKLDYPELHDIPRITIAEAKQHILLSLKARQRRGTIVLVGESGIGKTQIFDQLSAEENLRLYPVYTAHYGLMGAGIPMTKNVDSGFFKIAVPNGFPKEGEKAIVLFDEVNKGLRHSIDMFFTMMEAGVLFDYRLPDSALVCATMNPATANYAVTQIDTDVAFRRRVKFFYVLPDFKGFLHHAESKRFHDSDRDALGDVYPCHPEILSYFRAKPSCVYDVAAKDAHKQFSCPATIQTISLDAYLMEKENIPLTGKLAFSRFSSSIGTTMTSSLIGHIKDNTTTIDAGDVLKDFEKVRKAITKMIDKELREKLTELNLNVLKIMFATTPELKLTAKNFLAYIKPQPKDLIMSMLQQMRNIARDNSAEPYLIGLMDILQSDKNWTDLVTGMDSTHQEMDGLLKNG
jgi:hypothetical protein